MYSFCPGCGHKNSDNNNQFCVNCGYNFAQNNSSVQSMNNNYNSINQNQTYGQQVNNGYSNGLGVAGFVISLISLIMCCGSLSWLSLIFSIIGMKNAKKHNGVGHALSLAGLIISIVGLLIILFYIFYIVFVVSINAAIV